MLSHFFRAAAYLVLATAALAADDESLRAGHEFFENKIRPVLLDRCVKCHGEEKQKGKLRLDQREFFQRGGRAGALVQAGDPTASLLIQAIRKLDQDIQMPPGDEPQLTAEEIANFETWVKMGAPFPGAGGGGATVKTLDLAKAREFWSLQPLKPSTGSTIDQLVHAKLQAAGMKPSPPAEKPALLRRVTYDLTGLPPTTAEIDAFLADTAPDAFAKVVDRLLASPQYGVHWARHWFDVARYGDTKWVGAGEDKRWPFAYTYRDWVIAALNEDMPYDRFVSLQLAADQIPEARPADQAALGFLTVGRWFTGVMPDVIDDQIDAVTRGLLGLSVQCARCHDHKFDPISTKDYYALYGLFAAARMPVDGSGLLADLPDVSPVPVDPAIAQEIETLRAQVDDFLLTRATALRNHYRTREQLLIYLQAAEGLLQRTDKEVKEFAKAQGLDERILQRWTRYLKNTVKNQQPVFSPWHAAAALPEVDFAAQAAAVFEKEKAGKLNPHVAKLLTPVPESLPELARRYVELFLYYDSTEFLPDADQEKLRQVLRGNDSPVNVPLNEMGQFMTAEDLNTLIEKRRTVLAKSAALPEQADHWLSYQHEAAPVVAEIRKYLAERQEAVTAEMQSPTKIASYLMTAREAVTTPEGKFKALAKGKQLSERLLRRWMDFLQRMAKEDDPVFAVWSALAALKDADFESQSAGVIEQARASSNAVVASAFATPVKSLSDAAARYADLLLKYNQPQPLTEAGEEAIRRVLLAEDSPLRRAPDDYIDYLAQKENDELRNKEKKLLKLYLDSPGAPAKAMLLRDSSRSYAQRVFVRGNPNLPGEPAHGGFLTVLTPETPRPFQQGNGRRELAEAIVSPQNPLTARVIVNRVWQWHFGTALVKTPSDFGTRGAVPAQPELLDSLAARFMQEGWSLKKLHREILLSATWQQASRDNPQYRATDPENRLLWRMNRQRLTFEEMRDSMLAAAGRLDTTIGGKPSDLVKSIVRRRTVFGTVDRVTMPGFYRYFDFPGADAHVSERHETTVAQQALYLMNNGFVMDQAGHLARLSATRMEGTTPSVPRTDTVRPRASTQDDLRLEQLYLAVLGRQPGLEERRLALEFVNSQASSAAEPAAAGPADAWRYGWGRYDEATQRIIAFEPFPTFANNQFKGSAQDNDPELGRASLNARGGQAGINNNQAVIRRWVAPRAGQLSISGTLTVQPNAAQPSGDGVRARIVSSRAGKLGDWIAHGTEEPTDVTTQVEAGDTIDFLTDARGRDNAGGFVWAPVLRMEGEAGEKTFWDCAKDFKAPPKSTSTFDNWERLAQVLLESNEFMFLD